MQDCHYWFKKQFPACNLYVKIWFKPACHRGLICIKSELIKFHYVSQTSQYSNCCDTKSHFIFQYILHFYTFNISSKKRHLPLTHNIYKLTGILLWYTMSLIRTTLQSLPLSDGWQLGTLDIAYGKLTCSDVYL